MHPIFIIFKILTMKAETKEKVMKALTSNRAKAFYWQTMNGAIAIVIMMITDADWVYAPIAIATLNMITKYINTYERNK